MRSPTTLASPSAGMVEGLAGGAARAIPARRKGGMIEPRDVHDACILYVDDEETNLVLLGRILERQGYRRLVPCQDPREALGLIRNHAPDLVITDLHMPHLHGLDLIRELIREIGEETYLPIVVITADLSKDAEREALTRGAKDFITKPFDATQIRLRVRNLLHTRFLHRALREHNDRLEEMIQERTRELEAARHDLLERLALAAEFRDYVTGRHTQRVGLFASLLAEKLGLEAGEVDLIHRAAPLHDVGKIGIPDQILLKPGRLSVPEFDAMKEHVAVGARLLARGQSDLLHLAQEIALTHHERWDGSGYPRGLAGDDIPLVGQIVAVADVFDTLIHERPYKAAWPPEQAIAEIRHQRGRWFSPRIVDAFLEVLEERPDLLARLRQEELEAAAVARRHPSGYVE